MNKSEILEFNATRNDVAKRLQNETCPARFFFTQGIRRITAQATHVDVVRPTARSNRRYTVLCFYL